MPTNKYAVSSTFWVCAIGSVRKKNATKKKTCKKKACPFTGVFKPEKSSKTV